MSTRLALILGVLLLALALVQWRLRSVAGSPSLPSPARPAVSVEREPQPEKEIGQVEEPVIEIPEYVPPRITERPRTPLGFDAPEVDIVLEVPSVEGTVDEDGGVLPQVDAVSAP